MLAVSYFYSQRVLKQRAAEQSVQWICGILPHFQAFSRFGFFLLSGIFPTRPQTTNANR